MGAGRRVLALLLLLLLLCCLMRRLRQETEDMLRRLMRDRVLRSVSLDARLDHSRESLNDWLYGQWR